MMTSERIGLLAVPARKLLNTAYMTPVDSTTSGRREFYLLLWASIATVAALMFAAVALYLFLHQRTVILTHTPSQGQRPPVTQRPADVASTAFADVRDSDIPGRYRFFENGVELGEMVFKPDHTFINKDGTTFKQYRWDVSPEGLVIVWQRAKTHFSVFERPGVYVAPPGNKGGKEQRLEKVE
jgi:hypothetical protein